MYILWTVVAVLLIMAIPVAELAIMIEVGRRIGTWWTLLIVIFTAILGGVLLALFGKGLIEEIKAELGKGRLPKIQIIDGVLIFAGAVLLIIPGFLTDVLGILLLIPPTRKPIRNGIQRFIERYIYIDL
ncbi:MAG TPA: FxsA family protein [Bacillota bacterium]|nr:FxsA family protein [Candidatus Fermentithermobacillaceae bacterium]HOB30844.1 FxsA family protein [Bacillota bacterium]HOK64589.1 FxsA family protein [Bacillota bacterium]HOL12158.1 FxsA family protein [Bacillota bacterium]HOQ03272.1 FxsA family protein [Bacillota bacterium]